MTGNPWNWQPKPNIFYHKKLQRLISLKLPWSLQDNQESICCLHIYIICARQDSAVWNDRWVEMTRRKLSFYNMVEIYSECTCCDEDVMILLWVGTNPDTMNQSKYCRLNIFHNNSVQTPVLNPRANFKIIY